MSSDLSSSPDGSKSASTSNTRYKSELCRQFTENGSCPYGVKCQFAHGLSDLRSLARHPKYKTERCSNYTKTGTCPYGTRCHFLHSDDDAALKLHRQQQEIKSDDDDGGSSGCWSDGASPSRSQLSPPCGDALVTPCSDQVDEVASSFQDPLPLQMAPQNGMSNASTDILEAVDRKYRPQELPAGSEYDLNWLQRDASLSSFSLASLFNMSDNSSSSSSGDDSFFSADIMAVNRLLKPDRKGSEGATEGKAEEFSLWGAWQSQDGCVFKSLLDIVQNYCKS